MASSEDMGLRERKQTPEESHGAAGEAPRKAGEKDRRDSYFRFEETDTMKEVGSRHLREIISLLSPEEKAAYLEAVQRAPYLVATESDPVRFLRVENYNTWAAARRLAAYWTFRKRAFGDRAFLPLDLTGSGAMSDVDIQMLNTGHVALLPFDNDGRSVWFVDRAKFRLTETIMDHAFPGIFFMFQMMAENKMSQVDGVITCVALTSPMGATFDLRNTEQLALLFTEVFPVRLKKMHLLCCPPIIGRANFVETFVPMALRNVGTFFSSKSQVHVGYTEEDLLQKFMPHGFRRENVPCVVGGDWKYQQFIDWQRTRGLVVEKPAASEPGDGSADPGLASIIRYSIAMYAAKVENDQMKDSDPNNDDDAEVGRPSKGVDQQMGTLTAAEKDTILHDIYGSSDVPFAINKEVCEEGWARAQLQEAIDLVDDKDKGAYLEARARAPHLIELESDPLRYLRCNDMDPSASARRLVLYWEKRKAIFGETAFYPLSLTAKKSAMSAKSIEFVQCGVFGILPPDSKGRIPFIHNRARVIERLKEYPDVDKVQCFFYILALLAEREESRTHGVVIMTLFGRDASEQTQSLGFAKKLVAMLASGFVPIRVRAIHFVCSGESGTAMQRILASSLQVLGNWDYLKQRCVVHAFETDEDMVVDLEKYGFSRGGIPDFLGGNWHYTSFTEYLRARGVHETTLYDVGDELSSSAKRSKSDIGELNDDGVVKARANIRKMDSLYARRKREKFRIEVEVYHDQCRQLSEKNDSLGVDNRRIEGLIGDANQAVDRHQRAEVQALTRALAPPQQPTNELASSQPILAATSQYPPDSNQAVDRHQRAEAQALTRSLLARPHELPSNGLASIQSILGSTSHYPSAPMQQLQQPQQQRQSSYSQAQLLQASNLLDRRTQLFGQQQLGSGGAPNRRFSMAAQDAYTPNAQNVELLLYAQLAAAQRAPVDPVPPQNNRADLVFQQQPGNNGDTQLFEPNLNDPRLDPRYRGP